MPLALLFSSIFVLERQITQLTTQGNKKRLRWILMTKYRVLFHLDEGSNFRLKLALSNIENLLTDLGEGEVSVELVVNGAGVKLFVTETCPVPNRIKKLVNCGVVFAICENSLAANNLGRDFLLDTVEFVTSGVGELVKKQAEGWVYIKP